MSDDVVTTGQPSSAVATGRPRVPFQAAVSLLELGLLPTARINEALGLGGESVATVELLLDKWRMRRHLAARGISKESGPGFVEIGHSQPSGCSAETPREVTRLVTDFLVAVGLGNGPGHTEVKLTDAVRADPAFVDVQLELEPGDEVPPLTWNEDKVGHVIVRGATATEAIAHGRRLAAAVHVRTEPVA